MREGMFLNSENEMTVLRNPFFEEWDRPPITI